MTQISNKHFKVLIPNSLRSSRFLSFSKRRSNTRAKKRASERARMVWAKNYFSYSLPVSFPSPGSSWKRLLHRLALYYQLLHLSRDFKSSLWVIMAPFSARNLARYIFSNLNKPQVRDFWKQCEKGFFPCQIISDEIWRRSQVWKLSRDHAKSEFSHYGKLEGLAPTIFETTSALINSIVVLLRTQI